MISLLAREVSFGRCFIFERHNLVGIEPDLVMLRNGIRRRACELSAMHHGNTDIHPSDVDGADLLIDEVLRDGSIDVGLQLGFRHVG